MRELDNLITMQNLRTFANNGSNDSYDVHTSLTRTVAVHAFDTVVGMNFWKKDTGACVFTSTFPVAQTAILPELVSAFR